MGRNGGLGGFVTLIAFGAVIRTTHGDSLITGFVVLQQAEARLIKIVNNSPLLWSEER